MKNKLLLFGLFVMTMNIAEAQFSLSGEFRPRTEFRHGFGSIIPESAEPGLSVATRIRLNAGYKTESYKFFLSLQDVFVWGENRQILPNDQNNSFAVFQAWAEIGLGGGFSTKLGRQVLSYDDQRILGGLDWAQQGRNHDAALLKYKKDSFSADLALAFNQDHENAGGFVNVGNNFNTSGFFTYKVMQMLHLHKGWDKFSGSLLFMNNGFENHSLNLNETVYLQTFGTHLKYKTGALALEANGFLQTGRAIYGANYQDVESGYLAGLEAKYKVSDKVTVGLGAEIISGDSEADATATSAFFPLYGTNHKFNGFMDYFYVGNHANTVGLFDIHASANFKLDEKASLMVKVLNFSGEQELGSGEKQLGTEVDLVYKRGFKGFTIVAGYSHMFASDGMYELKGVAENLAADNQNWAWAMLVIKPKFLNGTK
ncbi:alginate export family protein [Tenacibaculum sp. 190524A05c]|uniref:alginate export family protein n=1 Tax=Tenacibaculum platacis TaxID=3137852 RepID=UPI0032B2BA34